MTSPRTDDEEIAERIADLEEALEQLRGELGGPPRGPLGFPRPPTPRELLRLTDQYAIPTAIAVLEANVRALRLLQQLVRLADAERTASVEADRTRDRVEAATRTTLDRLDVMLDELQREPLPREPESRRILEDARQLRNEVREWLDDGEQTVRKGTTREQDLERSAKSNDETVNDAIEIDVDDELQSIKAELDVDGWEVNEGGDTDSNGETDRVNDGADDNGSNGNGIDGEGKDDEGETDDQTGSNR